MKTSMSTLNPNAASYVPIALREASIENQDTAVRAARGTEKLSITDASKLKGQRDDNPQGTASHYNQVANMKFAVEESEMDLAYLQMSFPEMCDQSLLDVYTVNNGDLEASLEMLSLLESTETPDTLPDALGIGDVPEAASSGKYSTLTTKTKNMPSESCSSSGSSDLAVPS